MDGLTVGRIVHFVESDGMDTEYPEAKRHLAAIVAEVVDPEAGRANLQIFAAGASTEPVWSALAVPHSETMEPATWHWIERA